MRNGRIISWFLLSLTLSLGVCSCTNHPNKKTIIQMIDNGRDGLYRIETQQELKESYENLLDCIVEYLDDNLIKIDRQLFYAEKGVINRVVPQICTSQ